MKQFTECICHQNEKEKRKGVTFSNTLLTKNSITHLFISTICHFKGIKNIVQPLNPLIGESSIFEQALARGNIRKAKFVKEDLPKNLFWLGKELYEHREYYPCLYHIQTDYNLKDDTSRELQADILIA